MISKSYPYMSIAKKYGLDYGEVLRAEQAMRGKDILHPFNVIDACPDWREIYTDMQIAREYFYGVRSDVIPFQ